MLCVVAWFMALGWRARMSHDISALKFDAIQIGLGLLTIIALSSFLLAIQLGLLGHPNMHIAGNGSDSDYLRWYEDRTAGILPQMWVYSWSMWIYRIAVLLWDGYRLRCCAGYGGNVLVRMDCGKHCGLRRRCKGAISTTNYEINELNELLIVVFNSFIYQLVVLNRLSGIDIYLGTVKWL